MNDSFDSNRIEVFLDDSIEPIASYSPPLRFELDTSKLSDGPHKLRIEAFDSHGTKGVKIVHFNVRNGPGIAVSGIRDNDVLEGTVPILVNSFGGSVESNWEPSRAETPAPAPTWAWVMVIFLAAFGLYYGVEHWNPPAEVIAARAGQPLASAQAAPPAAVDAPPDSSREGAGAAAITFDREQGASVYGSMCSACHQAQGQGLPGVFPPIAGDPVVLDEDPREHIQIVLNGLQGKEIGGVAYSSPMPAFGSQLSDEQIAAVINFQRTSWGNDAPLITPEQVAEER